ncbi:MAG: glycosyltransferase family 2 protein [Micrococcales bacterium]|nr:glycosyltransferase family 2 protein [Micrococcales bacterium]
MTIELSICIPTYNRAFYLKQLIYSIIPQCFGGIEIVVSDNASTDETKAVIEEFQHSHTNIRYVRSEINVGADRNLLNAVSNAHGKYCWLMGSDDIIEPGGLNSVLNIIAKHPNLSGISVNFNTYTRDLTRVENAVLIAGGKLKADYLFDNIEECFSLLGLYFGYFSGQIINRRLWHDVVSREDVSSYCEGFLLVFLIGRILKVHPNWYYVNARCVGNRTGNDSILESMGFYQRQVIAHEVFERSLRAHFSPNTAVYRDVQNCALSTYILRDCVGYKSNNINYSALWSLILLYTRVYKSFYIYWIVVLPILITPNWAIRGIRVLYRLINKRRANA